MREALSGLIVAAVLLPLSGCVALGQGISNEIYLELGRCEGFYAALVARAPNEAAAAARKASLKAVIDAKASHPRPELDAAYREAASAGRRALEANAALGRETLNAYVARRSGHCESVLGGLNGL